MSNSLKNYETIRQYLLGRISDERILESIEESLFLDEGFCEKLELAEDELINDYCFGKLNEAELSDFEKTLLNNSERLSKVKLTQALKEKLNEQEKTEKVGLFNYLKAFFRQPIYAGGLALVLIAIFIGVILFSNSANNSELADLKSIYREKRPFEARLSEFEYAPYEVTRGNENLSETEKRKLRLVETKLLESVDKNPNAANHHSLGVFYLTQAKYVDSINELEQAVKLNDKNAVFQNDLGSAFFESAKAETDKKLENYARANESFSKAFDLDPKFLEALFNKALVLQSLNLSRQAREYWELYLQKDSTSKWADEARKNLEKLAQIQGSFKKKEQVLDDFLNAYRNGNEEFAWKINCQTKEMISGVWLPDQLTRRYLQARKNKDGTTAKESIEALSYIGNLERSKNADFFVSDLADYYQKVDDRKIDDLLRVKEFLSEGYKLALLSKYEKSIENFKIAKIILVKNKNNCEEKILDYWIAFSEIFLKQNKDPEEKLKNLGFFCASKKYKWLQSITLTRLGNYYFSQNNYSLGFKNYKLSFQIAESIGDTFNQLKTTSEIAYFYNEISEIAKAIYFLTKNLKIIDLYYESAIQSWRNYGNSFDILKEKKLFNSANDFSKEHSIIAKENFLDTDLYIESAISLVNLYTLLGQNQRAIELAEDNIKLLNNSDKNEINTTKIAYSSRQIGDNKRFLEDYNGALAEYDLAIKLYSDIKYETIDDYFAHKGKLICYEKINQQENFEIELEITLKLFEKFRTNILEEENRSSFFNREQSVSNITSNYYLKQNNPRKSFEISENSKARSLLDLIENKGFYDEKEFQIVFKDSAQPFSIEQIQQKLSPKVQIIQYAVLEDKIAVWLISNNQFEVFTTLIESDVLEQKVKDYLDLIKNRSPQSKQKSKELFDILLKPILTKLDKTRQLCIVPDGILYHLPFGSLVSSESEKYFIENFTLFYSPSATTSIILSEKAKIKDTEENLLVIGNPEFNREQNSTLQNLESAENEATEISKMYEKSTTLINSQATKAKVLANFSKTNIFHFAGHYLINPNSSLNSKLLLTQPTDSNDEFEGELRTSEILQLKNMNLKLAILSACDTGIERYYKGEGAIGMARTFLAIGTPLVIASQWKVESESTAELMKTFHRKRKVKGLTTSEALRQAQLELLANKDFSEPYFWSAFSAVGGNVNY